MNSASLQSYQASQYVQPLPPPTSPPSPPPIPPSLPLRPSFSFARFLAHALSLSLSVWPSLCGPLSLCVWRAGHNDGQLQPAIAGGRDEMPGRAGRHVLIFRAGVGHPWYASAGCTPGNPSTAHASLLLGYVC